MSRTVKDVAYILSAISGLDNHDKFTDGIPFEKTPDCALWRRHSIALTPARESGSRGSGQRRLFGSRWVPQTRPLDEGHYYHDRFQGIYQPVPGKLGDQPQRRSRSEQPHKIHQVDPGRGAPKVRRASFGDSRRHQRHHRPGISTGVGSRKYHAEEGGILGALQRWNLDALSLPARRWLCVSPQSEGFPLSVFPLDSSRRHGGRTGIQQRLR
ncbi:hypothetical protein B0T25DRAFT_262742 [Lasiosphaeria hispida]|uniref:Uncharacterized protein n=1 Tax=Lasiosphaeria hispida TaxID=260671 RepID=A0AAJ0HG69_9PEZI|nr:hypothetical protein B0T25DRAFT_262742 [Lasiosphaeria hispida]